MRAPNLHRSPDTLRTLYASNLYDPSCTYRLSCAPDLYDLPYAHHRHCASTPVLRSRSPRAGPNLTHLLLNFRLKGVPFLDGSPRIPHSMRRRVSRGGGPVMRAGQRAARSSRVGDACDAVESSTRSSFGSAPCSRPVRSRDLTNPGASALDSPLTGPHCHRTLHSMHSKCVRGVPFLGRVRSWPLISVLASARDAASR